MSSASEDLVGTTVQERYRILEFVAEGAMGAVYRGERLGLERAVAIKFLNPAFAASPQGKARFEREARAMSRLDHPNCVSVIDFGVSPAPYIVMEYVTGETLRDTLDGGPVSVERALYLCSGILAGLAHAHEQQIIHRDIKPANVMVTEAAGTDCLVRILDFGLAKLRDGASDISASWIVVGTPSYMSPEQGQGLEVDRRTDIYAVGVLLFELLTGEKPYSGDEPFQTLQMHREVAIPRLSARAPERSFPEGLQEILDRALAKDPEERFASAIEFTEALKTLGAALASTTIRATPLTKSKASAAFARTMPVGSLAVTTADSSAGSQTGWQTGSQTSSPRLQELALEATILPPSLAGASLTGQEGSHGDDEPGDEDHDKKSEPSFLNELEPSVQVKEPSRIELAPFRRSRPRARYVLLLPLLLLSVVALGAVMGWGPLGLRKASAPRAVAKEDSQAPRADKAQDAPVTAALPALDAGSMALGQVEPADSGVDERLLVDAGALALDAGEDAGLLELDGTELEPEAEPEEVLEAEDLADEDGEEGSALSPEDLAADAPNVDPPAPVEPPAPAPAPVRSVADALRLASAGQNEAAITGLLALARKQPKNASISYLLGNLYFDKMWWSVALEHYARAIRKDARQKRKPILIRNVIGALGSSKTRQKAASFLRTRIGAPALPHLRRAAKSDKSPMVRQGAAVLVKRMSPPKRSKKSKKRSGRH